MAAGVATLRIDPELARANIPAALRELPHWLTWVYGPPDEKGKRSKKPRASTVDPGQWRTFEGAIQAANGSAGIGFVFCKAGPDGYGKLKDESDDAYALRLMRLASEADELIGVDLDGCVNAAGVIEPWAQAIIDRAQTYTEYSISGSGVHLIGTGTLPPGRRRKHALEVYDRGRYFTVSARPVPDTPEGIRSIQPLIDWLYAEFFPVKPDPPPAPVLRRAVLSHDQVLKRAAAYLARIDGAVSGQGGHLQTLKAALHMVKGFNLDPVDALGLLLEHYNPRCEPPWSERELRHKVEDAARSNQPDGYLLDQLPVTPPPKSFAEQVATAIAQAPAVEKHGRPAKPDPAQPDAVLGPTLSLDGWREAQPVSWYVDSILAPGVLTAFSAAGGRKKSLLAQSLYVHLAAGATRPWLGIFRTVRDPLRVKVLDGECGPPRLRRRLREMVLGGLFSAEEVDRALANIDVRSIGSIKDPSLALEAVAAILEATPFDLLVLDPLRYFLPAGIESENDNLSMGAFLDRCRALAARYAVAVLVIAHDSAGGKALRGASSQQNVVETLWQIDQPDKADRDYLVLRNEKDRDPGAEFEVGIATVRGTPVPEGDGLLFPVSFERAELRAAPEKAVTHANEKAGRLLAIVRAVEAHYQSTGSGIGAKALEKAAQQTRATFYRDLGAALAGDLLYQPSPRGAIYPAGAKVTP